jgi:serine/threonine protein phosphatase PrpC
LGYNLFTIGGVVMSFLKQVLKNIFDPLFPQKDVRGFDEQPTRPLDAEALARALAGEGRRHVATGIAKSIMPAMAKSTNSIYLMMANSDGLNALPDFGIIGVAEHKSANRKKINLSGVALSTLANQLIQKAILDFLELEGFENLTPLQNIVVEAMNFTDQFILEKDPNVEYSLTAGLLFAEIIILGHRGSTRAYHIDRHHIERITDTELNVESSMATSNPSEVQTSPINTNRGVSIEGHEESIVYSRPVPRDGYILLCSSGLWKNLSEKEIHKIVLDREDPNDACRALASHIKEEESDQELSVLLLYFPPDYVPWR